MSGCDHSYRLLEKDKGRGAWIFYCEKCLDIKAKKDDYSLS